MLPTPVPEIQRTNLATTVCYLTYFNLLLFVLKLHCENYSQLPVGTSTKNYGY